MSDGEPHVAWVACGGRTMLGDLRLPPGGGGPHGVAHLEMRRQLKARSHLGHAG